MDAEEDLEAASLNFIPCFTWVRRGVAKAVPEKIELSKEELAQLIQKTQGEIKDLDEEEREDEEGESGGEDEEAMEDVESKTTIAAVDDGATTDDKFEAEYDLDKYDDDEDQVLMGIESLAVYPSNEDDPLITEKNDDDSEEEEDFNLLPTDNLIAVGHVEGDAAILEVYVYNAEEAHLYVHHETLLPALPLCMEWMDYSPNENSCGNYLAIGSMSPVIDVWDLDVVGSLEPDFNLGRKKNRRKKIPGIGHTDAVLSLSWNKNMRHVLASGSADSSVLLWDVSQCQVASTLSHPEKIQSLQFHPFEVETLLTGCCDGQARVYDCRSESCKSWSVSGEVERVLWDHFNPFSFLTSTEEGYVYYIDVRQEKPLWQLQAHSKACTGLTLSWQCPGCLVTASQDKTLKVWDIQSGTPSFIVEKNFKLGKIYAASSCPDAGFAVCLGGDNRSDNFKVWDIRQSTSVRNRFESRPLVQPSTRIEDTTPNQPDCKQTT